MTLIPPFEFDEDSEEFIDVFSRIVDVIEDPLNNDQVFVQKEDLFYIMRLLNDIGVLSYERKYTEGELNDGTDQ